MNNKKNMKIVSVIVSTILLMCSFNIVKASEIDKNNIIIDGMQKQNLSDDGKDLFQNTEESQLTLLNLNYSSGYEQS